MTGRGRGRGTSTKPPRGENGDKGNGKVRGGIRSSSSY